MSLTLEMKCVCLEEQKGREKKRNFGPSRGSRALRLLATGFVYTVLHPFQMELPKKARNRYPAGCKISHQQPAIRGGDVMPRG